MESILFSNIFISSEYPHRFPQFPFLYVCSFFLSLNNYERFVIIVAAPDIKASTMNRINVTLTVFFPGYFIIHVQLKYDSIENHCVAQFESEKKNLYCIVVIF